ncbi:MAG: tryptophan synthase subunit alpha [Alphaproteobacteria bacterium]|nr:tryptophan synthase subunit alpha [Alphaproteobacteria bacterium]
MNLRETLEKHRAEKSSAFIPFIMAGDPDLEATAQIIEKMQAAGADALELGVPFSEPVADGVTVQRAAERALARGTTLKQVIAMVKTLRGKGVTMPICLFSYLNPVYKMGYDAFVTEAVAAGVNGALLVDLPPEEATDYLSVAKEKGLETVFLCSPTTTAERLKLIDESSTGFVYYVSREGVTGAQDSLPQSLAEKLDKLREMLSNPVAVGFGISTPAHVAQLRGRADGIVVGSVLVRLMEEDPKTAAGAVIERIEQLTGKAA